MYRITFYVPIESIEIVKEAMFAKGAGKIEKYVKCAWQVLGEGQFLPLEGSNPFFGETGSAFPVMVPEYKVEMVCESKYIKEVIAALKKSHPYEQPAYQVIAVEEF
jgi:structural toxin protein (hemagglutinin/hemolysin) RtxA